MSHGEGPAQAPETVTDGTVAAEPDQSRRTAGTRRGAVARADVLQHTIGVVDTVDALIASGALPEPTFLWWDVRLQPALGTVELRMMDARQRSRTPQR